jgi:hypothetical protein
MRRLIIAILLVSIIFAACERSDQTPHTSHDGNIQAKEISPGIEVTDYTAIGKNSSANWPLDKVECNDTRIQKCLYYSYAGLHKMDYSIEYPQIVQLYDDEVMNKINKQLYEKFISNSLTVWNPGISFLQIDYDITLLNEYWLSIYFYGYAGEGSGYTEINEGMTFNLKTGDIVSLLDIYSLNGIIRLKDLLISDNCKIKDFSENSSFFYYSSLLESIPDHAEFLLRLFESPDLMSFYLREEKIVIIINASGRVWYYMEYEYIETIEPVEE